MSIYIRVLTYLLIFLLPAVANLVPHGGSIIFTLLAALGIWVWRKRKSRALFSRHEKIIMAVFAGYFLVCLLFYLANGVLREGMTLDWDLDHEIRFLGFIPIYYLVSRWTGMKQWVLWNGMVLGTISAIIFALFQIHTGQYTERISGPYNPVAFGTLTVVYGFMALAGIRYFYSRHPLLIAVPIIALCCSIAASFLSGTRTVLLAIPVLTLIFLIQMGSFRYPWRFRSIVLGVIILSSLVSFHMPNVHIDARFNDAVTDTMRFFTGEKDQLKGWEAFRLRVWEEGWKVYTEHPLLGTGRDQYLPAVREGSGIQCTHLHNMFLEFLVNYGILGLLAVFMVFAAPLWALILAASRNYHNPGAFDAAIAGIMLVVSFLVFSMTLPVFYKNIFIAIYLVHLAAVFTIIKLKADTPKELPEKLAGEIF